MSTVDPTTEVALPPTGRWGRAKHVVRGWQPRRVGLRTRIFFMFGLGALFLACFLAAAAYSFTRSSVVDQRDSAAIDARLARFTPPAGWTVEAVGGNIVAAAFTAKNDAGGARVTATSLGNDGGGDLANINRWRGQLGLQPLADLAAVERSDLVPGLLAVDLRDAKESDRMITVIAPSGGATWFFKLRGTVEAVESERAAFAAFVREVAGAGGAR